MKKGEKKTLKKEYLKAVKELLLNKLYDNFINCSVVIYNEPSISSFVFFINVDGYRHIFKAPFGLFESHLCSEALANIIVDEVKEWRKKFDN